ncbi:uncharacterized protein F4822DRAFT_422205 [Hypoxylon trugodes]|uniref:uncharacterized protein n=1 Tax=Hypoxylon trugodes TaxID=326681 RepID=UPI0021903814|nr:uncharacterized protein F4822DRAFT_422205 [Hypoxylon trugodes]KAI1383117.1 hypothetical protein F4822DRAFT_422205 [Hypoxylon trugodes]
MFLLFLSFFSSVSPIFGASGGVRCVMASIFHSCDREVCAVVLAGFRALPSRVLVTIELFRVVPGLGLGLWNED